MLYLLLPCFRRFVATGIAASLCIATVSCDRGPKRALRLNLTPGNAYHLTIRTSGEAKLIDSSGKEVKLPANSEHNFTIRPERADAHGDLPVSVEIGKTAFSFVYAQLDAAFQTYSFTMKLSQAGHVLEFGNLDTIRQGIRASISDKPELLDAISDDSLRAIIEPVIAIWPAVPVSAGDEWVRPDLFNPNSDTVESTKFRLESWDDSGAVVKFDSTIRPAARDISRADRKISGKGKGEIHIAPADGTIRSFESSQEMSGSVTDVKSGTVSKLNVNYRIQAELSPR